MRSTYAKEYRLLLKRLRAARLAAGMKQEDVATAFKRHQSFVSKVEAGERRIDPIELWHLARLYGKPIAFFLPEREATIR